MLFFNAFLYTDYLGKKEGIIFKKIYYTIASPVNERSRFQKYIRE